MQNSTTFQVYNASAGSGKTFTLVKEYLKILLLSNDIFQFQKVLAITFTNKAAGEMKERVLKNLQAFAEGFETDLHAKILEETALDRDVIKKRSKKIIDAILQNYSAFSITTIDSFTHKIIKSFAYDLGLSLNFEVEMDANLLLNEAVDLLISKIGTNPELTKTLIDFSLDKADDDKSWDIANELYEFSKILLNENDAHHFNKLTQKKIADFTLLRQKLAQHQKQIKNHAKKIGEEGLQAINTMGLAHNDFYRSMLPNHFVALTQNIEKAKFFDQNKLRERIEENNFYAKSKSEDTKTAIEGIIPQLLDLYQESEQLFQQFTLNKLILKSLIPLAVLNNINLELTTLKQENNVRLNAEFNQLISDSIKDQPAPFIYERIGQRFMHYFIDEMQDTSVLQWQNLVPLIDNALAQENSSLLLVGDGKQAIYRWRGGQAEQFINLGSDGQNSTNPFHVAKTTKTLETNYRSYSEIIDFNNHFFTHVANFLENESYKKLYIEGNKQYENKKKGGFVSLTFLEKEEEKTEELIKYPKKVLEKIHSLLNQFQPNEICVLTRKKKEGQEIAQFLSENEIRVVSPDSLLLKNNSKINFIRNVLQIIQHPYDEETRFEILYFLHNHLNIVESKDFFFHRFAKQLPWSIFNQLKEYGILFTQAAFEQLPFYEKIETIVRVFKLATTSDAYIQFFLDIVLEQQQKGISIQEFLDFWEEKKHVLSIVAPENSNAVQVMTIHKSKGLEFPVVIFPYDLDIYRQINPKVWLNQLPENFSPFNELLIPFNKDINYINDRGLEIYHEQRAVLELDNFNLLYVALTRAVEQLHIITEKKTTIKGEENTNFYSGIFINFLKQKQFWKEDVLEYKFGNQNRNSIPKKEKSIVTLQQEFISSPWQEHNIYMLANASKLWNTKQKKAIDFGVLIHEMMAKIITKNDVNTIVHRYQQQGILSQDKTIDVTKNINQIVNHPELKNYFSNQVTVFNEREILAIDGQIIIPDRLVFNKKQQVTIIDYKTGKPSNTYHQQLLKYEQVLKKMNCEIEKKLLIYIGKEILVEEVH
ncbi:UvrD-helicase domain-containing protein [Tenacibaculum sp. UWU-22]|uniref:UvrD-helicase domain-containing protein n=1 Tax=Tenacibaculum sp. UWU-22 TaxID=3234187 RepID=UPI0034DB2AFE